MTNQVNLLPGELKPKGFALKLSGKLKKFATVSFALFLITFVLYFAANLFFTFQRRNQLSQEENLKGTIRALEGTEQSLILAQDRIKKIGLIRAQNDATQELEIANQVIGINLPEVRIDEISIDASKSTIAISTDRSINITRYFSQLVSQNFKTVRIESFSYDAEDGYKVEITLAK